MKSYHLTDSQRLVVEQNMKLAPHFAWRALHSGKLPQSIGIGEAISIGYYALCKAAATYDAGRGIKFSTYFYRVASNEFRGIICEQMRINRLCNGEVLSLDAFADGTGARSETRNADALMAADLDPCEAVCAYYDRSLLYDALECLEPYDRLIVRELFFEGKNQQRVADERGVTQPAVSYRCKKALSIMRTHLQQHFEGDDTYELGNMPNMRQQR